MSSAATRPPLVALLRWELAARVLLGGAIVIAVALWRDVEAGPVVAALSCAVFGAVGDLGRGLRDRRLQVASAIGSPLAIAAGVVVADRLALTTVGFAVGLFAATLLARAGVIAYLVGLLGVVAFLVGVSLGLDGSSVSAADVLLGGVCGSLLALALSGAGQLVPLRRIVPPAGAAALLRGEMGVGAALAAATRLREPATLYALAVGVGGGIAWIVASQLVDRPAWVVFAAIAALAPRREDARLKTRDIVLSNLGGLGLIGVLFLLGLPVWAVALLVVAAFAIGLLVVVVSPALFRTLVVPFSILVAAGSLGLDSAVSERVITVLLGVVIGTAVGSGLYAILARLDPGDETVPVVTRADG